MARWLVLVGVIGGGCTKLNPAFPLDPDPTDTSGAQTTTSGSDTHPTSSGGPSTTSSGETTSSTSTTDPVATASTSATESGATTEPGTTTEPDTTATTGESACLGECGTPGCSACPGGAVVDLGEFSIDAYEVSGEAYALFLADEVVSESQPPACAWNTTFEPTPWPPADLALPVVGVDWCDASAYCRWAGKRLCGSIAGGPADFAAPTLASDQWYVACSGPMKWLFPYSPTFNGETCNSAFDPMPGLAPSGGFPNCQGYPPGLYDMSGNVWEWVDACDGDGMENQCLRRGGSFYSDAQKDLRCDLWSYRPRTTALDHVGIRCCSK